MHDSGGNPTFNQDDNIHGDMEPAEEDEFTIVQHHISLAQLHWKMAWTTLSIIWDALQFASTAFARSMISFGTAGYQMVKASTAWAHQGVLG